MTTRRILALLLTLCMVFSTFPVTALAAEIDPDDGDTSPAESVQAEVADTNDAEPPQEEEQTPEPEPEDTQDEEKAEQPTTLPEADQPADDGQDDSDDIATDSDEGSEEAKLGGTSEPGYNSKAYNCNRGLYYDSLKEAVEACTEGDEIRLTNDDTATETIEVKKSVTINFYGQNYSVDDGFEGDAVFEVTEGRKTLKFENPGQDGGLDCEANNITGITGIKMDVNSSVVIDSKIGLGGDGCVGIEATKGSISVQAGGTVRAGDTAISLPSGSASVAVDGGDVIGYKTGISSNSTGTIYVADGEVYGVQYGIHNNGGGGILVYGGYVIAQETAAIASFSRVTVEGTAKIIGEDQNCSSLINLDYAAFIIGGNDNYPLIYGPISSSAISTNQIDIRGGYFNVEPNYGYVNAGCKRGQLLDLSEAIGGINSDLFGADEKRLQVVYGVTTDWYCVTEGGRLSVTSPDDVPYTGQDMTPVLNVKCGDDTIYPIGADYDDGYTVVWKDSVGNTVNEIKKVGTYTGAVTYDYETVEVTFKVVRNKLADNIETIEPAVKQVFTGSPVRPVSFKYTMHDTGDTEYTMNEGTDYTVAAIRNNTNVGEAEITITGKGSFQGQFTFMFPIQQADMEEVVVTLADGPYVYTGSPVEPEVTATLGEYVLVKDKDYTIEYDNNKQVSDANTQAGVVLKAKEGGNFTGETEHTMFAIGQVVDADPDNEDSTHSVVFSGVGAEPSLSIVYETYVEGDEGWEKDQTPLTKGTGYTVTYAVDTTAANNTAKLDETTALPLDAGSYIATVTGAGAYAGVEITVPVTVEKFDVSTLAKARITLSPSSGWAAGNDLPTVAKVTIKDNGYELVPDTDYTYVIKDAEGNNATSPMTAQEYTVVITGTGTNFADTSITKTFTAGAAAASITKDDETVYYATIAEAIEAAKSGDTIMLQADYNDAAMIRIAKSVTLDLNGHSITRTTESGNTVIYINAANVVLKDTAEEPGSINLVTQNTGDTYGVYVDNHGSATISDISIGGMTFGVINNPNCSVTINSGTISGTYAGIANNCGSVTVNDNASISGFFGILVYGNGNEGSATLTMNGGTVTGTDSFAISGNGTPSNAGTVININSGTVVSNGTDCPAIYHPQAGVLNVGIENCGEDHAHPTITGPTGIEMRSGTLNVYCGTITATGEFSATGNTNGSSVVGAAVAASQHTTNQAITLNIYGGTLNATGEGSYGIFEKDLQDTAEGGEIAINVSGNADVSGKTDAVRIDDIDTPIAQGDETVSANISGGTFNTPVPDSYTAANMASTSAVNGNGKYEIKESRTITWKNGETVLLVDKVVLGEDAVYPATATAVTRNPWECETYTHIGWATRNAAAEAMTLPAVSEDAIYYAVFSTTSNDALIGETYYVTLAEAVEKAPDGAVIKLLKDTKVTSITVSKKLTLDMNGKKITSDVPNIFCVNETGDLTITGNGKITGPANGQNFDGRVLILVEKGKLTIENGTLTATGEGSDGMYGVYVSNGGTAVFGKESVDPETGDEQVEGPTITSHFAAIGTNNTTSPAYVTVIAGTYTANAAPTNNEWWNYFCAPVYAASAGRYDLQGGTFSGYYGISSRYANVVQTVTLGDAVLNASSGKQVFVDNKTGTTSQSDRHIQATSSTLTLSPGYVWVSKDNDKFEVAVAEAKVTVDGVDTYYATLVDAVEAATTGTVTLLADTSGAGIFVAAADDKNITIDLGGHTYTCNGPAVGSIGSESQALHLEKNNTIALTNGTVACTEDSGVWMLVQNYSNLTLTNVTLDGTGLADEYVGLCTLSNNNGVVTIGDGTVLIAKEGNYAFDVCATTYYPDGARVTVSDGAVINGDVLYDVWGSIPAENKTALTITGGTFNGEFEVEEALAVAANEKFTISGGAFKEPVSPLWMDGDGETKLCTTTLKNDAGLYYLVDAIPVTFNANGGKIGEQDTVVQYVPKGESYQSTLDAENNEAPQAARVGYTWDSTTWYTDDACTTAFDKTAAITDAMNVYAKWTINQYRINLTSTGNKTTEGTTIATLSGGGSYDFNTAVTLKAPAVSGYSFVGWYYPGDDVDDESTALSTDRSFQFTIDEDAVVNHIVADTNNVIKIVAVYEASDVNSAFKLNVTGSKYKISGVEGVSPRATQTDSSTFDVPANTSVTVTFTDSGKTLLYWVNGSKSIVAKSAEYTFTMVGDTTLEAVVTQAPETEYEAKLIFVSKDALNGQVLSSQQIYHEPDAPQFDSQINYPAAPGLIGRTFDHWALADGTEATEENILNAVTTSNGTILVHPVYIQNDAKYTVTVKYVMPGEGGDTLELKEATTTAETKVGTGTTLEAPEIDGNTFSCWKDEADNILGYTTSLYIRPTTDVTIFAVYNDAGEATPTITVTDFFASENGAKYRNSFTVTRSVPDNYTVVESGILYTNDKIVGDAADEDAILALLTFDSVSSNQAAVVRDTSTENNSTTTVHINSKNAARIFYVRGFVTVTWDENGTTKSNTFLSENYLKGSYNLYNNIIIG